ncbi:MAG: serine/threonine-protein phosphatase [Lachnospiraceae bacterium]|nr:serine/threonine-protein phosphatase [Lachnospiraceae bacterium]
MVLYYAALHEKGRRENNEDSMAVHKMETKAGELTMALVCDGMGGEEAGELASGHVVERLSVWFYDELPELLRGSFSKGRIRKGLQRELFRVHEELRQYGHEHMLRCGTTMTLLLMVGRRYLLFQCGDSLAYCIRRKIRLLAPGQGNARGVERCIGIGRFVKPQMNSGIVPASGSFLLLSDGLTHFVGEEDYRVALSPKKLDGREEAQRALRELAKAALRRGETDNMSALYLKCG